MTSFNLMCLVKDPVSKRSPTEALGVSTWTCEFWGGHRKPIAGGDSAEEWAEVDQGRGEDSAEGRELGGEQEVEAQR